MVIECISITAEFMGNSTCCSYPYLPHWYITLTPANWQSCILVLIGDVIDSILLKILVTECSFIHPYRGTLALLLFIQQILCHIPQPIETVLFRQFQLVI